MAKELAEWQRIERGLQKKYAKQLWGPFTAAVYRYKLIEPDDRITVALDGSSEAYLLAKLLQVYARFSKVPFEVVVQAAEGVEVYDELLRLPISKAGDECNKRAQPLCMDDVIETTLSGMFYDGTLRGLTPKEHADGTETIRPLYLIRKADVAAWMRWCGITIDRKNVFPATEALFQALGQRDEEVEKSILQSIHAVCPETLPARYLNIADQIPLEN